MCLAVPGRIISINSGAAPVRGPAGVPPPGDGRNGRVDFAGVVKEVNLSCVPDAAVGDYVIVHVGFAISRLNEAEAGRVFDYLKEMDEIRELKQ